MVLDETDREAHRKRLPNHLGEILAVLRLRRWHHGGRGGVDWQRKDFCYLVREVD